MGFVRNFFLNSRFLHLFTVYSCVLMLFTCFGNSAAQRISNSVGNELFLDKLIEKYGTNGHISVEGLGNLLAQIQDTPTVLGDKHMPVDVEKFVPSRRIQDSKNSSQIEVSYPNSNVTDILPCPPLTPNTSICWTTRCLSAKEIFCFHKLAEDGQADRSQFLSMLPTVLYQLQNSSCRSKGIVVTSVHVKPKAHEVWGYSFLCVTLINLCALTGVIFLPLMKKNIYQRLLVFMVALAVGTLAGSGLLFLIPDAFELSEETTHNYVFKATTVMGGIYLFFLLERIMKIIAEWRKRASHGEDGVDINDVPVYSVIGKTTIDNDPNFKMSFEIPDEAARADGHSHGCISVSESSTKLINMVKDNGLAQEDIYIVNNGDARNGDIMAVNPRCKTPAVPHKSAIKSVAWMVIFGDGVHNFIDGLSIGAAFTINVMTGFSVAIAVICEELPHELGDFAILLNSGMSMRQALSYNFLSACMCYLGLVFGIIAGERSSGAPWIFAVAGGMFLYISLVDMLPEVNHAAEEEDKNVCSQVKLLLVQNAGMLMGFGLMLVFAIYGESIIVLV